MLLSACLFCWLACSLDLAGLVSTASAGDSIPASHAAAFEPGLAGESLAHAVLDEFRASSNRRDADDAADLEDDSDDDDDRPYGICLFWFTSLSVVDRHGLTSNSRPTANRLSASHRLPVLRC
jgi:hypothetical protein